MELAVAGSKAANLQNNSSPNEDEAQDNYS